jgi:hypothetical protein
VTGPGGALLGEMDSGQSLLKCCKVLPGVSAERSVVVFVILKKEAAFAVNPYVIGQSVSLSCKTDNSLAGVSVAAGNELIVSKLVTTASCRRDSFSPDIFETSFHLCLS